MNNKMIMGLGFVSAATILTIANVDKVDAASALTATINLNMRSGPSTSYSKIGMVKQGDSVQYITASKGWFKVKYNNKTGWVSSNYMKFGVSSSNSNSNNVNKNNISGTAVNMKKVAKVNLNMRSGPSTSYSKTGMIKQGESVQCISQSNGWYKVKTNYGTTGWVTGQYLTNSTISNNTNHNTTTNTQVKGRTLSNLIVVNRTYHTLKYYVNGQVAYSTSCSVGKYSSPTPTGKYSVINKIVNRPYYKKNIPGGDPKNPLGNRWLGLSIGSGYGIHGNVNENSIGYHVTEGCVRLHNADVAKLYNMVPVGTTVIITDKNTNKEACQDYGIYIK